MNIETGPDPSLLGNIREGTYDVTAGIAPAGDVDHHVSIRTVEHAGHRLEVHTSYRVFIDGTEFPDPIHVADDGSVHYHGLPQYATSSALTLVKLIAERLLTGEVPPLVGESTPDTADHGHGSGHGGGRHDDGGPH